MKKRSMRAFTLGELLVVISIVAVLTAVLLPVFQQARERAAQGVCLSHMTSLGVALAQYSQDYDGGLIKDFYAFPAGCNWAAPNGQLFYSWRYAVKPYVPEVSTFACPQNSYSGDWQYWTSNGQFAATGANAYFLPSSYTVNRNVIGFANGNCNDPVNTPEGLAKRSQITHPSTTIELTDSRTGWMDASVTFIGGNLSSMQNVNPASYQGGVVPTYPAGDGAFLNHNGFVHFLMADGHTRSMKLASSASPIDLWRSGYSSSDIQSFIANMPAEYN